MREFEQEFLIRLASTWLACRLATMGGTPVHPSHRPVRDLHSLGWSLLGEFDYSTEMRLMCLEAVGGARAGKSAQFPVLA